MHDGARPEDALRRRRGIGIDVVLEDQRAEGGALALDRRLVLDDDGNTLERPRAPSVFMYLASAFLAWVSRGAEKALGRAAGRGQGGQVGLEPGVGVSLIKKERKQNHTTGQ